MIEEPLRKVSIEEFRQESAGPSHGVPRIDCEIPLANREIGRRIYRKPVPGIFVHFENDGVFLRSNPQEPEIPSTFDVDAYLEPYLAKLEALGRELVGAGNFAYVVVEQIDRRPPAGRERAPWRSGEFYQLALAAGGDGEYSRLELVRTTEQCDAQAECYNRDRLKLSPEDIARIIAPSS
jgi:hypothetical protein